MHVVEGISDRVVALDHGVKIAEGTFEQVATDERVDRGVPRHQGGGDEVSRTGARPLLRLEAVDTYYGPIHILQGRDARGRARASSSACSAATPPGSRRR